LLRIFDPVVVSAVATSGGASALADLRSRRVPNPLTLGIALTGLALALLHMTAVSVPAALAGFVLGLLLMLPGHIAGATGAGDVKLFAAIGTLLGPAGIAIAFVYTAIAGGIIALFVAVARRRLGITMERTAALVRTGGANVVDIEHASADNRFAYAPAIAIGALIAALGF
jgi:prepilin peptidase CpaA